MAIFQAKTDISSQNHGYHAWPVLLGTVEIVENSYICLLTLKMTQNRLKTVKNSVFTAF
jgi:hypothetical protein